MKKKDERYDSSHSNCYGRTILINDKLFFKFCKKNWKLNENI